MINRRTTEQQRAKNAWQNVEAVEQHFAEEKKRKEYGSWARGLPALIQTNGLGQALAFLAAKGKGDDSKHQTLLYTHLTGWLRERLQPNEKNTDFLAWVLTQNSGVYRRATREAIEYALWLRRFAEAKGWGGEGDLKDE